MKAGTAAWLYSRETQSIWIWTDKAASGDHGHGNITNGGALQTTDVDIASGDKLVITDASDSNKVARASVSFDGLTATQALTKKGTWETFNNYTHPTTAGNKHIPANGATGNYLKYGGSSGTAAWTAPLTAWPAIATHTDTLPSTKLIDDRFKTNETNILYTQDMICDTEFSTSTAYAVGDIVTYNNSLYEFTSVHSAGAWNSADVTQIDVVGIIGNINAVLEGGAVVCQIIQ